MVFTVYRSCMRICRCNFKGAVIYLGRFTYLAALGDSSAYYSIPYWSILIFLPLVTLISSWIVSRFAPDAAGTGSSTYINSFHFKNAIIKPRTTIIKFLRQVQFSAAVLQADLRAQLF